MKKIMLILTVLLFCWSCDVPGDLTDTENQMESRGVGDSPDPSINDELEDPTNPGWSTSGPRPDPPTFPKPVYSYLPNVRVYFFYDRYYQKPLIVEGTTNMISAFGWVPEICKCSYNYIHSNCGIANLSDYYFNDAMSSIKVFNDTENTIDVVFYKHKNYGIGQGFGGTHSIYEESFSIESGKAMEFESLRRHPIELDLTSWNDDISSIQIKTRHPKSY